MSNDKTEDFPATHTPLKKKRSYFWFFVIIIALFLFWNSYRVSKEVPEILHNTNPKADKAPDDAENGKAQFISLGGLGPDSQYGLLITIYNRGASVIRTELNDSKYEDIFNTTGYMGQIIGDESLLACGDNGIPVQVVGNGTPASRAGLKCGDRMTAIVLKNALRITLTSLEDLRDALRKTVPGDRIQLEIVRPNKEKKLLQLTLEKYPVSILSPETSITDYADYVNSHGMQGIFWDTHDQTGFDGGHNLLHPLIRSGVDRKTRKMNRDYPSFMMTLSSLNGMNHVEKDELPWPDSVLRTPNKRSTVLPRDLSLARELDEVDLRNGYWDYLSEESNAERAVFRKILKRRKLEVRKIYSLVQKGKTEQRKYHFVLQVELRNLDNRPRTCSYCLDGPTGLPRDGLWYSAGRKTGPQWKSYGLRDFVFQTETEGAKILDNRTISFDKADPITSRTLDYAGIDSQYFQCTMMPTKGALAIEETAPIRVGMKSASYSSFTNISFRLKSTELKLSPFGTSGDICSHEYLVFSGPKAAAVLKEYGLEKTLIYGWFAPIAVPLRELLYYFKDHLVFHFALAIILWTVVVRTGLLWLSVKQSKHSIIISALTPEMSRIKEEYKDDPIRLMKAQREVWRKAGTHPLYGCLPLCIQLPILFGLYKVLATDVHLFSAPLILPTVSWCPSLAAPDMMFNWSSFWFYCGLDRINLGQGMFLPGPYFNVLPTVTILLFWYQQHYMMANHSDDPETVLQNRMMKILMIWIGFLFFKIPSGLCLYFIATCLWGVIERKIISKRLKRNMTI